MQFHMPLLQKGFTVSLQKYQVSNNILFITFSFNGIWCQFMSECTFSIVAIRRHIKISNLVVNHFQITLKKIFFENPESQTGLPAKPLSNFYSFFIRVSKFSLRLDALIFLDNFECKCFLKFDDPIFHKLLQTSFVNMFLLLQTCTYGCIFTILILLLFFLRLIYISDNIVDANQSFKIIKQKTHLFKVGPSHSKQKSF